MNRNGKTRVTTAVAVLVAASIGISATPAMAAGVPAKSPISASPSVTPTDAYGLTASDWQGVAARAAAAGDAEGAALAQSRAAALTPGRASTNSIISTAAKAAVKLLLRDGGPALAKALKPFSPKMAKWVSAHSTKLANLLDELESWQEAPLIALFMHAGAPYDVAVDAAHWIVIFVGV